MNNFAGIAKYDPTQSVADVTQQLPRDSHMTLVYNPINSQHRYLSNAVNRMAVDQSILAVSHNAPPWPTSTSPDQKLDQLLIHIRDVGQNVAQLKADNTSLKGDNTSLKARVDNLEGENQDLRQAVDGSTIPLYKLRRRILLDQARKTILRAWAPRDPRARWTDLCGAMIMSDALTFVNSNHIFPRNLLNAAFDMIYTGQSSVRLDGNDIAHEADKNLIRDAIVHSDAGQDAMILANIFGCVYNEDLE